MKPGLPQLALALAASSSFAIEPHPKAVPNPHKVGEVDIAANLEFIIADPKTLPGIVLDETDAVLKGTWQYSTHTPPYVGIGYLHDQKSGKGTKSVIWTPEIPKTGNAFATSFTISRAGCGAVEP